MNGLNDKGFTIIPKVNDFLRLLADVQAQSFYQARLEELREKKIDSPPNQLFYLEWIWWNVKGGVGEDELTQYNDLIPEVEIGPYRVDFLVDVTKNVEARYRDISETTLELIRTIVPKVVIEIDGYTWHRRTPEEAEYEDIRQNYLIAQSYRVFRFSARQVFESADACVYEVVKFLAKIMPPLWERIARREFGPVSKELELT